METVTTPHQVEGVRITRAITSGTFSLDGGCWDVDNNVYVLGTDTECVVIDAPHSVEPILEAVAGRTVTAIILTHAHDDHVSVVKELAQATGAPTYLHPEDRVLWDMSHDFPPDHDLRDGQEFAVGPVTVRVIHTPGHSPGSCCLSVPQLGVLFSGDTLFQGGPGATGRSYSSFEVIMQSLQSSVLTLPAETLVLTGHGDSTTVGAEKPEVPAWIARGH